MTTGHLIPPQVDSPHPYYQDTRRHGCYWCGSLRSHRNHQPLWWRIIHPGARYR